MHADSHETPYWVCLGLQNTRKPTYDHYASVRVGAPDDVNMYVHFTRLPHYSFSEPNAFYRQLHLDESAGTFHGSQMHHHICGVGKSPVFRSHSMESCESETTNLEDFLPRSSSGTTGAKVTQHTGT